MNIYYEAGKVGIAVGGTVYASLTYSEIAAILTAVYVLVQLFVAIPRMLDTWSDLWGRVKRAFGRK